MDALLSVICCVAVDIMIESSNPLASDVEHAWYVRYNTLWLFWCCYLDSSVMMRDDFLGYETIILVFVVN